MLMLKRSTNALLVSAILLGLGFSVHAEETEKKGPVTVEQVIEAEKYQEKLEEVDAAKRSEIATAPRRKHKLTEDQAINQLKYMMIQAWKRMENDLVKKGSFKPFGFVMGPTGEVNPVFIKDQHLMSSELALAAIANTLVGIAETQTKWGVGLMYIKKQGETDDGEKRHTIEVVTEHIAGWARYWSVPFKVENEQVKMGKPLETPMQPRYFSKVRQQ